MNIQGLTIKTRNNEYCRNIEKVPKWDKAL